MNARVVYFAFVAACAVDPEAPAPPAQPEPVQDDVVLCDGAIDCSVAPPCWVAWCHQIQRDDPLHGTTDRWGTCRMDPVIDGEPCNYGAGRCRNRECVTP